MNLKIKLKQKLSKYSHKCLYDQIAKLLNINPKYNENWLKDIEKRTNLIENYGYLTVPWINGTLLGSVRKKDFTKFLNGLTIK